MMYAVSDGRLYTGGDSKGAFSWSKTQRGNTCNDVKEGKWMGYMKVTNIGGIYSYSGKVER